MSTRIQQRSVNYHGLKYAKRGTAISLQYGPDAEAQAKEMGYVFYKESTGTDMDELAAMVAACDTVLTVAQTLVHLAGALGVPTHVLTPLGSSWRYGLSSGPGAMPWYKSVTIHRQVKPGDWAQPMDSTKKAIDALCRSPEHADI